MKAKSKTNKSKKIFSLNTHFAGHYGVPPLPTGAEIFISMETPNQGVKIKNMKVCGLDFQGETINEVFNKTVYSLAAILMKMEYDGENPKYDQEKYNDFVFKKRRELMTSYSNYISDIECREVLSKYSNK